MIRFGFSDLKKFLNTDANVEQTRAALTSLGLEVEKVIYPEHLEAFKIVRIIETKPHPDADKLKICTVDNGENHLQIVCGASNAREGLNTVLAPIGTKIPNGEFKIKQSKIRGQDSFGMLCSYGELLLEGDDSGIIEVGADAAIGQSFISYSGLDDHVFEVAITPNRSDCLSIIGIARDLAAMRHGEFISPEIPNINFVNNQQAKISITSAQGELASIFISLEITNVTNISSPLWLKNFLRKANIKSISAIVDIANYITCVYGQPLHVYDRDKLTGNLSVALAKEGELFVGLNAKEYVLASEDIIVRDDNKAQCIAGILGSNLSACSDNTTNILIEAANFNKIAISKTGRRLKVDSDARYRFERGVDKELASKAILIAASMIQSLCGGQVIEPSIVDHKVYSKNIITLPVNFVAKKLGIALNFDIIKSILSNLGFLVQEESENSLTVEVPSWRLDVSIPEDLVEEIARIWGYDKIMPCPIPLLVCNNGYMISREQRIIFDSKRILAALGYNEVVTWSFSNSLDVKNFAELQDDLFIKNPLSSELNYMRPSIIPNLLQVSANNAARSILEVSIFETGPIFQMFNEQIIELSCIAGVKYGFKYYKSWQNPDLEYNFFDIKADIAYLLEEFKIDINKCQLNSGGPNYYHPTKSATIKMGQNIIGFFGQLHPKISNYYNLKYSCFIFEIFRDKLPKGKETKGKKSELILSNFPVVKKDLAFIINKKYEIGPIIAAIKKLDSKLIQTVHLFDLYQGQNIPDDCKSIAFAYTMQSEEATLNNEQIHELMNKIIDFMAKQYNATLRRDF